jgi:membrane-bound lytic murein transglycosylase A
MRLVRPLVALIVLAALAGGCKKAAERPFEFPTYDKDYERPLPPGELALRKITDPKQIPDFTFACSNPSGLKYAIQCSLHYMAKPSSHKAFPYGNVTHAQAVAGLQAMLRLLDAGLSPAEMNAVIRRDFDVYMSVGCDYLGTVLYTCYYTPIFEGSPIRTDRFRCPLYKPPADMVKLPDGRPASPMPDRRTIESQDLYQGNELAWMADPFEAYVAQIQGTVKLKMTDGSLITYGYTGNNGHDYKSIRAELVKDGKIGKRDGLPAMIRYFREHPDQVQEYTWRNPRYVFFAVVEDGQPRGSLNEPVTPYRSIATDKAIYPPGCLAFAATLVPQDRGGQIVDAPFTHFVLDQDTGGAIRAPGRCDLYLGVGDKAGELAGRAQNEGKLYYLFLKPGASVTPAAPTTPAAPITPAAPATPAEPVPVAPPEPTPAGIAPPATVTTPAP